MNIVGYSKSAVTNITTYRGKCSRKYHGCVPICMHFYISVNILSQKQEALRSPTEQVICGRFYQAISS